MTIEEIIKDFIDTTKERLKTPISGAFLWSFLIYNWRPIFLLIFSKASIENKIIVINHEYCNFWAIILPVFIALFYTLIIPKLMLGIDKELYETKKERVNTKYDATEHLKDRHIRIAEKDFLLKSTESGSKDIQVLGDQLEQEKRSHEQIADSLKSRINELTTELGETTELLNSTILKSNTLAIEKQEKTNEHKIFVRIIKTLMALNQDEVKTFIDVVAVRNTATNVPIPDDMIIKFQELKIIDFTRSTGLVKITNYGAEFSKVIKNIDVY